MRRPHPQAQAQELLELYPTANRGDNNKDEYRIGRSPNKRSWIDKAKEPVEEIRVKDEERASKLDELRDHPIAKIIGKRQRREEYLPKRGR